MKRQFAFSLIVGLSLGAAAAYASPLDSSGLKQSNTVIQKVNANPSVKAEQQIPIAETTLQREEQQVPDKVDLNDAGQVSNGGVTVPDGQQNSIDVGALQLRHPGNNIDLDNSEKVSHGNVTLERQEKYSISGATIQQRGQPSNVLDENQLSNVDSTAQEQQWSQSGEVGLQQEAQSSGSDADLNNADQAATDLGTLLAPGQISGGGTLIISSPAHLG